MRKKIITTGTIIIIILLLFSSCVTSTNVWFETNIDGAEIYIDGERIGKTPIEYKLSNAIWEDPDVVIRKKGYKDLRVGLKKEVKAVNLICGIIFWWPSLLWCYGPKDKQYFEMIKEND